MKLTKEMIDCLKIRLVMPGRCSECPRVDTVERGISDNKCLISIMCDEWIWEQGANHEH